MNCAKKCLNRGNRAYRDMKHRPVLLFVGSAFVCYVIIMAASYFWGRYEVRSSSQKSMYNGKWNGLKLMETRNELSGLLNQLKRDYAKLHCQMLDISAKHGYKVDKRVSQFGGYCKQASQSKNGSHAFDDTLAEALSHFFLSKSVASFGDGPGEYKRYLDQSGRLRRYDAYDGAPYSPENSQEQVKFLDLTSPLYGLPAYDWVISLEVAEHIPQAYESVYVDNLVRHAREGIVLSWAVPGHGGLAHVNPRSLQYVMNTMREKGFTHDDAKSVLLQRQCTLRWLRVNVNVYVRDTKSPLNLVDL